MATLGIPGMGSGLRYEYGIFKQTVRDGWQHEQPDHWLARPDPWEVPRPDRSGRGAAGLLVRYSRGSVAARPGPAIDAHRDSLRPPGGRLRRANRQHAAPLVRRHAGLFRLPAVQRRRLHRRAGRDAHGRNADARALPGRLDHRRARGCASCSSTSWWPARSPTRFAASAPPATTGPRCPTKSRCS